MSYRYKYMAYLIERPVVGPCEWASGNGKEGCTGTAVCDRTSLNIRLCTSPVLSIPEIKYRLSSCRYLFLH